MSANDARFVYEDDKPFGPRVLDRKHGRWMGIDLVREMAAVIPSKKPAGTLAALVDDYIKTGNLDSLEAMDKIIREKMA